MKKNNVWRGAAGLVCLLMIAGCEPRKTTADSNHPEPGSLLPVEGAYNVRDMGGYKTADGKTVKYGEIIRAGDLDKITAADIAYFEKLKIKTVIDFRTDDEKKDAPDTAIATVKKTYAVTIGLDKMTNMKALISNSTAENDAVMVDYNKFLAVNCEEQGREFFSIIQDKNNIPILFHCSAGKDRTGFMAALFLSALGVDRETIIEDYLLSAGYVKEKYAPVATQLPSLAPLFDVRREYIEAAFDIIDKQYGGINKYLTGNLKVDLKKMKSLYTE